jgi:hypothetical protein
MFVRHMNLAFTPFHTDNYFAGHTKYKPLAL